MAHSSKEYQKQYIRARRERQKLKKLEEKYINALKQSKCPEDVNEAIKNISDLLAYLHEVNDALTKMHLQVYKPIKIR